MFTKSSFAKASSSDKSSADKSADEAKIEENDDKKKEISSDKNENIIESEEESAEDAEEIKEISKEEECLNSWKRCQADFENYRKRQEESKKELKNFMLEDLALQILPVVDNFQMSLDHIPEDQGKSSWVEGILHIQRQLETILKDNGIYEVEVKEGDAFNPEIHEAIHQESENSEQESENKVKKIVSKGYKIGDKVIRAAKVIVN